MLKRRRKSVGLAAILFAVIVGFASSVAGQIHAQVGELDYVDVALTLEVPDQHNSVSDQDLDIIVVNNGLRTAYDVEVVVDVVSPDRSHYAIISTITLVYADVPVGTSSAENNERTFRWSIPALGPLQREEVQVKVNHRDQKPDAMDREWDHHKIPHEYFGEVTTASYDSNPGNNTSRVWSYLSGEAQEEYKQAHGNYSVEVTVDNPSPSPGDTVNFTIAARKSPGVVPFIDSKVDIEMTGGLSVSGTPTYAAGFLGNTNHTSLPDTWRYSNGVINVGTLDFDDGGGGGSYFVTLPVTVSSSAVVNEQCLTATLTGNPPPGNGPRDDDISDNVAKLCLGDAPMEPFLSGQVDAFTVYPCVDVTDPPCDSTDDVRVRAVNSIGHVLAPGAAVFQVDPTTARIYDDHTNSSNVLQSVNDGNTVSWQTSVNPDRVYTRGLSSGIELYYSRTPYTGTTGWGGLTFGISARDMDGNTPPPGKVFLRSTSSGNEIRKAESPNYEELRTAPTGISTPTTRLNYFLEFEKLGTYKVTWHAVAERSSLHGSENCNPNTADPPVNQIFCASETYTLSSGRWPIWRWKTAAQALMSLPVGTR